MKFITAISCIAFALPAFAQERTPQDIALSVCHSARDGSVSALFNETEKVSVALAMMTAERDALKARVQELEAKAKAVD